MRKTSLQLSILAGGVLCSSVTLAVPMTITQTGSLGNLTTTPPTLETNWVTNTNLEDGVHFTPAANNPAPMSFTPFDTSLGTLNSVSIVVNGAFIGELSAQNQATAAENTTIEAAALNLRFVVDVFNNATAFPSSSLEASGFTFDTNYNAALNLTAPWSSGTNSPPALPLVLTPGGPVVQSTGLAGSFSGLTFNYTGAALSGFTGGNWTLGCGARGDADFSVSGGAPLTGQQSWATCSATVTYTYEEVNENPEPASLALMGLGLASMGLLRHRRSV